MSKYRWKWIVIYVVTSWIFGLGIFYGFGKTAGSFGASMFVAPGLLAFMWKKIF